MAKEKGKSLKELVAGYKAENLRLGTLGEFDMTVKAISTGNIAIDSITGVGGLPRGRIIELAGYEGAGKTTTALQAAARLQQAGGNILFLDYERSLDETYCKALGIDVTDDSFIYSQPKTVEQGAEIFRKLMDTGELDMMIMDSVANAASQKELDADTGHILVGDKQKVMYQYMRQITGPIMDHQVCAVFLNHLQDVIATMPTAGKQTTTPGGRALKFAASMRIFYKVMQQIKSNEFDVLTKSKEATVTSKNVRITVVKNKVAPPMKEAVVRVRFGKGFSQAYSVYDILKKYGALTGSTWIAVPEELRSAKGTEKYNGEEQLLKALESDGAWLDRMEKYAVDLLHEHGPQEADHEEWKEELAE